MNRPSDQQTENDSVDSDAVYAFLKGFQSSLCKQLEALDGGAKFVDDPWQREEPAPKLPMPRDCRLGVLVG